MRMKSGFEWRLRYGKTGIRFETEATARREWNQVSNNNGIRFPMMANTLRECNDILNWNWQNHAKAMYKESGDSEVLWNEWITIYKPGVWWRISFFLHSFSCLLNTQLASACTSFTLGDSESSLLRTIVVFLSTCYSWFLSPLAFGFYHP
jgi:hypothetical protein